MDSLDNRVEAARAELRLKTRELADGVALLRSAPSARVEDLRSYTRDLENRKNAVERALAVWSDALTELEAAPPSDSAAKPLTTAAS